MIAADPDQVWEIAGDPARIADWVPAVATAPAAGDDRRCTLADGAELVERILERSSAGRYYEYEIVDVPMPVWRESGCIRVYGCGMGAALGGARLYGAERDTLQLGSDAVLDAGAPSVDLSQYGSDDRPTVARLRRAFRSVGVAHA